MMWRYKVFLTLIFRHEFFHWQMSLRCRLKIVQKLRLQNLKIKIYFLNSFRTAPFLRGDVERSETERFK